MREAFHHDLDNVSEDLVAMASLVQKALTSATESLLTADLGAAEKVIAADVHIDAAQIELDEKIVDLLARQSPVATDLRVLVSALRMSATLERMGDLAKHVAITARRNHPETAVPEHLQDSVRAIAELTVRSIADAATVIRERDLALAGAVEKRDEEIDDLHLQILREVKGIEALPVSQVVDLTLLARFYERLGDHAVSLVRRIGFLVTGEELNAREVVLHPHEDDAAVD